MTQSVISAIDGATGNVIRSAEVVSAPKARTCWPAPTWFGGNDWETGAYSPRTNTMYMPLRNACARIMATRDGGIDLYALAARNFSGRFSPKP